MEQIYDDLLVHVYSMADWDGVIIMGDLNARVGNLSDLCETDNLPPRGVLDEVVNGHGRKLISFLLESKCCLINGRVGHNNFTLENTRGKSIVDYYLVRHCDYEQVEEFEVISCEELLESGANVHEKSRMPDHKTLRMKFRVSNYGMQTDDENLGSKSYRKTVI